MYLYEIEEQIYLLVDIFPDDDVVHVLDSVEANSSQKKILEAITNFHDQQILYHHYLSSRAVSITTKFISYQNEYKQAISDVINTHKQKKYIEDLTVCNKEMVSTLKEMQNLSDIDFQEQEIPDKFQQLFENLREEMSALLKAVSGVVECNRLLSEMLDLKDNLTISQKEYYIIKSYALYEDSIRLITDYLSDSSRISTSYNTISEVLRELKEREENLTLLIDFLDEIEELPEDKFLKNVRHNIAHVSHVHMEDISSDEVKSPLHSNNNLVFSFGEMEKAVDFSFKLLQSVQLIYNRSIINHIDLHISNWTDFIFDNYEPREIEKYSVEEFIKKFDLTNEEVNQLKSEKDSINPYIVFNN